MGDGRSSRHADAAVAMVAYGLDGTPERSIAFERRGGLMNRILNDLLIPDIEKLGAEVLIHGRHRRTMDAYRSVRRWWREGGRLECAWQFQ